MSCKDCGGTHYGSVACPFLCEVCGVNTGPCQRDDCPRIALAAEREQVHPAPREFPLQPAAGMPVEPTTLMGEKLIDYAHRMRIEACSAWSGVVVDGNVDQAKCEYAAAIERYLEGAINEIYAYAERVGGENAKLRGSQQLPRVEDELELSRLRSELSTARAALDRALEDAQQLSCQLQDRANP